MSIQDALDKVREGNWDREIGNDVANAYQNGDLVDNSTCLHVIAVLLTALNCFVEKE
jgi:hypothetical protein